MFRSKHDLEMFKKDMEFALKGINNDIKSVENRLPSCGPCVSEDQFNRSEKRVTALLWRIVDLEAKLGIKNES